MSDKEYLHLEVPEFLRFRFLLELAGLQLLFLDRLVVSVLWLQLPGALVSSLSVVCPDFPHDLLQVRLRGESLITKMSKTHIPSAWWAVLNSFKCPCDSVCVHTPEWTWMNVEEEHTTQFVRDYTPTTTRCLCRAYGGQSAQPFFSCLYVDESYFILHIVCEWTKSKLFIFINKTHTSQVNTYIWFDVGILGTHTHSKQSLSCISELKTMYIKTTSDMRDPSLCGHFVSLCSGFASFVLFCVFLWFALYLSGCFACGHFCVSNVFVSLFGNLGCFCCKDLCLHLCFASYVSFCSSGCCVFDHSGVLLCLHGHFVYFCFNFAGLACCYDNLFRPLVITNRGAHEGSIASSITSLPKSLFITQKPQQRPMYVGVHEPERLHLPVVDADKHRDHTWPWV